MSNKSAIEALDQHQFERHPPPSTLIMCILGFTIINIIAFDLKQAIPSDIAAGVVLFGFYIHAIIWLKVLRDEWCWIFIDTKNTIFFYILGWPYNSK
jgi:hypothetical protein